MEFVLVGRKKCPKGTENSPIWPCTVVKAADITAEFPQRQKLADIVCCSHSHMIPEKRLVEGFAGFRQLLVLLQRYVYLVEVGGGIFERS